LLIIIVVKVGVVENFGMEVDEFKVVVEECEFEIIWQRYGIVNNAKLDTLMIYCDWEDGCSLDEWWSSEVFARQSTHKMINCARKKKSYDKAFTYRCTYQIIVSVGMFSNGVHYFVNIIHFKNKVFSKSFKDLGVERVTTWGVVYARQHHV